MQWHVFVHVQQDLWSLCNHEFVLLIITVNDRFISAICKPQDQRIKHFLKEHVWKIGGHLSTF